MECNGKTVVCGEKKDRVQLTTGKSLQSRQSCNASMIFTLAVDAARVMPQRRRRVAMRCRPLTLGVTKGGGWLRTPDSAALPPSGEDSSCP